MNFLQRLSSKPAASDAYGSVSTLEENATTSPQVDSFQDADNFKYATGSLQTPAVIIKDKLKGPPFSADSLCDVPLPSASKIKAPNSIASSTGNLFSSWSAAGQNAIAAITKKDTTSTSKDSESEPTEGKLMGEININWNYVTPAEPKVSDDAEDGLSDAERLKQTKKVLEEERKGQFATDLHAAVISQDLGALKQLNHKGADLGAKNQRGQCVLHVASGYGYPQMVKTLLQFKAHADCRDEVCPVILSYHAFTQA
ncbi:TPA: E3 ubiquitin-protein ligase mib1 [Trebouxia sp. C0004]